jgi:hypothetical protein
LIVTIIPSSNIRLFHGFISDNDCKNLLANSHDGTFILRFQSRRRQKLIQEKKYANICLQYRVNGRIKKMAIKYQDGNFSQDMLSEESRDRPNEMLEYISYRNSSNVLTHIIVDSQSGFTIPFQEILRFFTLENAGKKRKLDTLEDVGSYLNEWTL